MILMSDISNIFRRVLTEEALAHYILGSIASDSIYKHDIFIEISNTHKYHNSYDIFNKSHHQPDNHTFLKKKGLPYMRKRA